MALAGSVQDIDIANIDNLGVVIDPLFKITDIQKKLIAAGINTQVFFTTLRALVYDYGFNANTAFSIMKDLMDKPPEARESVLSKFLFTVGRKVGYLYNVSKSSKDIENIEFVKVLPPYQSVDKSSAASQEPFGFIRYNPRDMTDPNSKNKMFDPYNSAMDVNVLLDDGSNMGGLAINRYGDIKLIVSDRASSHLDEDKNTKMERAQNELAQSSYKRIKNTMENTMRQIFREDYGKSMEGFYEAPEWTPALLAKRETRIKWIVQKNLRNWRANRISKKRELLWNCGYVQYSYDPDTGNATLQDPNDTKLLCNWIREKTVKYYDEKVLEPVYKHALSKLDKSTHANYPVTEDELGHFLLEWLDINWSSPQEQSKLLYADHLIKLVSRYNFKNAYQYFYNWLVINGIIEATKNVNSAVVESLVGDAASSMEPDRAKKLSFLAVYIGNISNESQGSQLIDITYKDSDFTSSLETFLDSRAEYIELSEREKYAQEVASNPDRMQGFVKRWSMALIDSTIASLYPATTLEEIPAFKVVRTPTRQYAYPTIYDTLIQEEIFQDLNFRPMGSDYTSQISDLDKLAELHAGLELGFDAMGLPVPGGQEGVRLKLNDLFTRNGHVDKKDGIGQFKFTLLTAMGPMFGLPNLDKREIDIKMNGSEYRLNIFFSENKAMRANALQMYSTEEEELADALIKLDGLSLDNESEFASRFALTGRQRVLRPKPNERLEITIRPTVEFTICNTPIYRYTVSFVNAKALVSNGEKNSTMVINEIVSDSPSNEIKVTVPAGHSGFVKCTVEALLQNLEVFAKGDMPPVKVIRTKTCLRSKENYTEFDNGFRAYEKIVIEPNLAYVQAIGDDECRKATWSVDIGRHMNSTCIEAFEGMGIPFSNLKDIFGVCYLHHMEHHYNNPTSDWYFKTVWYEGRRMDKEGLGIALEGATVPFKDIAQYARLDAKSAQELNTRKSKRTLNVLKELFLLRDYNKFLETLNGSPDTQELYNGINTISLPTFKVVALEKMYSNGRLALDEAFRIASEELPLLTVINFCAVILEMMLSDHTGSFNVCYPEKYYAENKFKFGVQYAMESIKELNYRMNNLFANMALEKNIADNDKSKTNGQVYQFYQYFAMSWNQLNRAAPNIPNTFQVFRDIKEAATDTGLTSPEQQNPALPELLGMVTAYATFKRYSENLKQAAKQRAMAGPNTSLYQTKYRGFYSSETTLPYFYELIYDVDSQLTQLPTTERDTFAVLSEFGLSLAHGDIKESVPETKTRYLQNEIEKKWKEFISSISVDDETADPTKLEEVALACKEYNTMLL